MEAVAGWKLPRHQAVGGGSWAARKATVDLAARLTRLAQEERTRLRQVDAELWRMRRRFVKRRGDVGEAQWTAYPAPEDLDLICGGSVGARLDLQAQDSFEDGGSVSGSLVSMRSQDPSLLSARSLASQASQGSSLSRDDLANHHSKTLSQLLITNGEIDLNKILTLHLAAISLPSFTSHSSSVPALSQPVTRYANLLPSYLLSPKVICRCRGKCKCNDIKPLEATVAVNSQIEMIIMTAIQVLARLSKAKLHILIALAHNPAFLRTLMSDETTKRQTLAIQESGIMSAINYHKSYRCTLVEASSASMSQLKEKKSVVFKMLLPHHYPVFQIPVFSLKSGGVMGDRDESVPMMLNLYKQVTLGKPIEDEESGLSVLPDFCNTRLAIISDDGSDFALISKSGNIVKPTSMNLTENLTALVRSTSKVEEIKKEAEDPIASVNYNPRPKFSKNPVVMMESLIGLAKENLGLSVKPPRTQMGISEVQRRRMESEQLRCSILRRLSNTERMAIAKEAAKATHNQKEMMRKSDKSKLENFSTLMASVLPKRSIMSLARNCSRKERDFMFKPLNKGGLGFGDLVLKENVLAQMEAQDNRKDAKSSGVGRLPSILTTSKSQTLLIESDRVKNEIVGAELKEKVRHFVGSDQALRRFQDSESEPNLNSKMDESMDLPSRSSFSSY